MNDITQSSASRRPRPGGRSREIVNRIYACTLDMLSDKGLSGVSFHEVAVAAGVSRSTLYRRWPERNELVLDAILDSVTQQIIPIELGGLEEEMRSVLEQIGSYLSSPLGHAVLIAGLELGAKDSPAGRRQTALWRQRLLDFEPIFDRAVARGELPSDFDREMALAMADGALYVRIILHSRPIDRDWIDRIIKLWRRLT